MSAAALPDSAPGGLLAEAGDDDGMGVDPAVSYEAGLAETDGDMELAESPSDDVRTGLMRSSQSQLDLVEMEVERTLVAKLHTASPMLRRTASGREVPPMSLSRVSSGGEAPPVGAHASGAPIPLPGLGHAHSMPLGKVPGLGRARSGSAASQSPIGQALEGEGGALRREGSGSRRGPAGSPRRSPTGSRAGDAWASAGEGSGSDTGAIGARASRQRGAAAAETKASAAERDAAGASERAAAEHDVVQYKRVFNPASALPLVREGFGAVVEDSFTKCFEEHPPDAWNWNVYLAPAWAVGVAVRYFVLFPLRLLCFLLGWLLFGVAFLMAKQFCRGARQRQWERGLIQFICTIFVVSWSGVIKFHHSRPEPLPGKCPGVFVANHSTMIDFIILQASNCYAVVGQQHTGWVGWLQTHVLKALDCVWFDRGETQNRAAVAQKLKEHVRDPKRNPLLVFPEGTCVNNHYVMQFKKGVFDLGVQINPVAIKYNNIFVDAYWNSRRKSFGMHLFDLMTSWCVVCDVWFLEPQFQRPDESSVDFAQRVQDMIAKRAGIASVQWDGYMKYWAPSQRFIRARQAAFAETLRDEPEREQQAKTEPDSPARRSRIAGVGLDAREVASRHEPSALDGAGAADDTAGGARRRRGRG